MANENEIRGMFKWVEDHPDLGKIDVCIPNAGFCKNATFLNGKKRVSICQILNCVFLDKSQIF